MLKKGMYYICSPLSASTKEEIQKMIDDGEPIEVNCHFCNSHYTFTVDELKEMYDCCTR